MEELLGHIRKSLSPEAIVSGVLWWVIPAVLTAAVTFALDLPFLSLAIVAGMALLIVAALVLQWKRSRPSPKLSDGPGRGTLFPVPRLDERLPEVHVGYVDGQMHVLQPWRRELREKRLPRGEELQKIEITSSEQLERWKKSANKWRDAFDNYVRRAMPLQEQLIMNDYDSYEGRLLSTPFNEDHEGWLTELSKRTDAIRRYLGEPVE